MAFLFKARILALNIYNLLKQTIREFIEDDAIRLGASLSYYTIFSLPPLLIIIISISGYFFGEDAVKGKIFGQINGLMGNDAALQIQEAIKNVEMSEANYFAPIIGVVILLVGASGVFTEIQDSINFIWGIKAKPKKGFVRFLKNRLLSFSMIGTVGFLLLVGLFVNTILDILINKLELLFPHEIIYIFYLVNILFVFLITTALFTFIFKTLPDGKLVFSDCLVGAAFTAILFMIGKFAIGAYLSSSAIASIYGAAGSLVLLLIWVYYSAFILFFGVEFTKVFSHAHGSKIIPNEYSVQVKHFDFEVLSKPKKVRIKIKTDQEISEELLNGKSQKL